MELIPSYTSVFKGVFIFVVFVSGVRAEEASRRRVPPEDGGALRMRPVHSELSQGLFDVVSVKRQSQVMSTLL